jgi:uncharacterized membrane protein
MARSTIASTAWRLVLSFLSLAIAGYGIYFLIQYPSITGSPEFAGKYQGLSPFFVQSHFLGGALALITACFQLWSKPGGGLHKIIGYAYVVSVSMGAVGGCYLAFYSYLGWSTGAAFLTLDVLWVFSTFYGIYSALKGNQQAHRRWMMRSVAMTFAAISLRLQMPLLMLFIDVDLAYLIVAWGCWIINLILVEIYLRRKKH